MKEPLVTVVVITYNSEKYVLETLESIKSQTYADIELIVSDDCSKDNTVAIAERWLNENKDRFIDTKLITTEVNTGIPANCNRGWKAAKGEWIKYIAGDDTLKIDAIESFVEFIDKNAETKIVHSNIDMYVDDFTEKNFKSIYSSAFFNEKLSIDKQFGLLSLRSFIPAPSVIINKGLLEELSGFDETIPLCEDYPFWLKVNDAGYLFYYLDKVTANYRLHNASVSTSSENHLFSLFFKTEIVVYKKYIKGKRGRLFDFFREYEYNLKFFFEKKNLNKGKYMLLYKCLHFPYRIYEKYLLKKIIR